MKQLVELLTRGMNAEELDEMSKRNKRISDELHAQTVIPEDETRGGSPITADLNFLSLLIMRIKAKTVLEFGTWIGTSAIAMAESGADIVYTCDYRYWFKTRHPKVKYFQARSTDMMRGLLKQGIKADFCFVDAKLSDDDTTMLLEFFEPGRVAIAIHDIELKNGRNNVTFLGGKALDAEVLLPMADEPYDIQGTRVNDIVGLVIGNELLTEIYA